jgi:hypothetical protein
VDFGTRELNRFPGLREFDLFHAVRSEKRDGLVLQWFFHDGSFLC